MNEIQTTGIVTGLNSKRYPSKNVLLHPVVKFETQDGKTVEFESKTGSNVPPKVGEEVTVYYDPFRPEEAKITLGSAIRFNPRILPILGLMILGMFLFFMLVFVMLIVWAML